MATALVVVLGPLRPLAPARGSLDCYPALVILAGMATYVHGMAHWGRFYVIGLAHLPFAVALRFIPDWAPLVYGALGSLALCWAGFRLLGFLGRDVGAARASFPSPVTAAWQRPADGEPCH